MDQRILKTAGVNVEHYQGHSLCSASASAAKSNGANISDLLLAGRWSNERTHLPNSIINHVKR